MATRTVEFPPDGQRRRVAPRDLVAMWRQFSSRVPAEFALGVAQHESGFALNEVDTEPSGYVSIGVFQLSEEEAADVGLQGADLSSLEDSCRVFAALCEQRLDAILEAAGITGPLPSDVWAYLVIAHNQGLSAALKSIRTYGLDWSRYKARNQSEYGLKLARYGDDAINGGEQRLAAKGAGVGLAMTAAVLALKWWLS